MYGLADPICGRRTRALSGSRPDGNHEEDATIFTKGAGDNDTTAVRSIVSGRVSQPRPLVDWIVSHMGPGATFVAPIFHASMHNPLKPSGATISAIRSPVIL